MSPSGPDCKETCAGLPKTSLDNGFSLVRRIVALSGLALSAPAPFASAQTLGEALLKPLCALWLQGQPTDDEQLKRFFQAMPASRQAAWLAAGPQHMSVDGRAVDDAGRVLRETQSGRGEAVHHGGV